MVFEYIQERFRTAYKYFACPQRRHRGGLHRAQTLAKQGTKVEEFGKEEDDDQSLGLSRLTEDEESESDDEDGASDPSTKEGEKTLGTSLMNMVLSGENKPSSSPNGLLDSEEEEKGSVADQDGPPDDLHYVFDKMIFTGGKVNVAEPLGLHGCMKTGILVTQSSKCFQPPTVVCSICKRDGHLKDECPEDFKKIELKPLPPMTERFREILDGLCRLCYCKTATLHLPVS